MFYQTGDCRVPLLHTGRRRLGDRQREPHLVMLRGQVVVELDEVPQGISRSLPGDSLRNPVGNRRRVGPPSGDAHERAPVDANRRSSVATVGIRSPLSISEKDDAAIPARSPSTFWLNPFAGRELRTRTSAAMPVTSVHYSRVNMTRLSSPRSTPLWRLSPTCSRRSSMATCRLP